MIGISCPSDNCIHAHSSASVVMMLKDTLLAVCDETSIFTKVGVIWLPVPPPPSSSLESESEQALSANTICTSASIIKKKYFFVLTIFVSFTFISLVCVVSVVSLVC